MPDSSHQCPKLNDGHGWTIETLKIFMDERRDHMEILRKAEDRRYAEVNIEKEKALKIKEEADKAALGLAREIQTYKDEKANQLREQISSERGLYVTQPEMRAEISKIEAMLKPVSDYVQSIQGRSGGLAAGWGVILGLATLAAVGIALATLIVEAMKAR